MFVEVGETFEQAVMKNINRIIDFFICKIVIYNVLISFLGLYVFWVFITENNKGHILVLDDKGS